MFGLLNSRMKASQNEQLLLIAESVQSGLSLSVAIRLTTLEGRKEDKLFLRFADLLDEGKTPLDAIQKVGFPHDIQEVFVKSLSNPNFAEAFALQCCLLQNRHRIFLQIINILAYPFLLLFFAGLIFQLVLMFVIPQLKTLYLDYGMPLPGFINALNALSSKGAGIVIFVLFLLILFLFQKTFFPRLWYNIPIFGGIYHRLFLSSFFQTTAFLLKQGIPYSEILANEEKATRNRAFKNDLRLAAEKVEQGVSIVDLVFAFSWLFPLWLAPLLTSCQKVDDQASVFQQAALIINSQTKGLVLFLQSSALLCSLLIIISLTGTIFASLFVPMISLISSLS